MKFYRQYLLLICFSCFISQVNAEQLPYYYGVGVGPTSYAQAGGGDPGLDLYFGKFVTNNILMEAGYSNLSEDGSEDIPSQASTLFAGGLVNLYSQKNQLYSGFFTAGLHSWYYKLAPENDSGVDLYYGIGGMYALDKKLSIRVTVKRYILNPKILGKEIDEEIMLTSFGIQYRP